MPTVDLGPCECCHSCCWAEIASISFDFSTDFLPSLTIPCSDWCYTSRTGVATLDRNTFSFRSGDYTAYFGSFSGGITVTGGGLCAESAQAWTTNFIFTAWCRGHTPRNGGPFRHWEAYFSTLPRGGYNIRPDDCENTGEKYLSDFNYPVGSIHGVLPTISSCTDLHGYTATGQTNHHTTSINNSYGTTLSVTFNGLP